MEQLILILEWAAAVVVTTLIGINAFFIARLVQKVESASTGVTGLTFKVEELAGKVAHQGDSIEKFSEVYLDVAILKREADAARKHRGNGSYLEDADV